MKNKIAVRLTLYFSVALLLFSLIIGAVFLFLFQANTVELYKADMEKRATTIASTLSEYMNSEASAGSNAGGKKSGYGSYLKFLDEIAMADVWIVDENLNLITNGQNEAQQLNYAQLPENADAMVSQVFQGETVFSEGFSQLIDTPTLTLGMPIVAEGNITGALLLHAPVEGMNAPIKQGIGILSISIAVALLLCVLLSFVLALSFTKPLKKMKISTARLANGDYTAKTQVNQKDEIGELAATIDVLSDKLDFASREKERLDNLRRDFVANISHELRTPVTVLRGSLEALCDQVVTEKNQVDDYHSHMLAEVKFLQRLVNDLLDLSRLQNTDFQMEMQELSLCDVLSDAVRSAGQMATSKNVAIRLLQDSQDSQHCTLMGDYGRLRQMFLIILDNAIKFSPENGVVSVSMKNNAINIADQGPGIPPADLPYIFDRFYKVKSTENKSGTGLGLAISKQIADRHGISIQVESKEKEGTIFTFAFQAPSLL